MEEVIGLILDTLGKERTLKFQPALQNVFATSALLKKNLVLMNERFTTIS